MANFGVLKLYGKPRKLMSRLRADIHIGDTQMLLEPGLGWKTGDLIGIAPSNMRFRQYESATLVSYDDESGIAVVDSELTYYQYGLMNSTASDYNGVDLRGEVYLLTRNVIIQGEDLDDWGC